MALQLLGELLLDRSNYHVMTRFITIPDFMKKMMVLLRSKKGVSLEAFNVFKIFAANPKKPPEIVSILLKNRDKLIDFFEEFQKGSGGQCPPVCIFFFDAVFARKKPLALSPPDPLFIGGRELQPLSLSLFVCVRVLFGHMQKRIVPLFLCVLRSSTSCRQMKYVFAVRTV
mgnify:CR=1 FL=1